MLNRQNFTINFGQGLDTKTDPYQLSPGKFLSLQNSVFDKGGQLQKRNGFGALTTLPITTTKYLTTFNGDLTALGVQFEAYSSPTKGWVNKGNLQPLGLSTLSLIRSSTDQNQTDSQTAPNGLVCVAYTDNVPSGGSNVPIIKYAVFDSTTGQNLIAPTAIPSIATGTATGTARVFVVGTYFLVVYTNLIGGSSYLYYVAISNTNLNAPIITGQIDSAAYTPSTTLSWDGVVYNSSISNTSMLYIAYNSTAAGQHIEIQSIDQSLVVSTLGSLSGETATQMSITIDNTTLTPIVWLAYYNSATTTSRVAAFNTSFATILAPKTIGTTLTSLNTTSAAQNGLLTVYQEIQNNYGYDSSIPTHYIEKTTVTQSGTVSTPVVFVRSVGLASKAFIYNDMIYVLVAYQSQYQPSYFLLNQSAQVVAKLAYSNGGGYYTAGLPSVSLNNDVAEISYLFKDLLQATNKTSTGATAGVYSQTGINLASFDLDYPNISTGEIGHNLNVSGGYITSYDGYSPVENGFFVWPDNVETSFSSTGGNIAAQPNGSTNTNAYAYQVTYEWTDNQGNLIRSAPSIPVAVTTVGSGTTGSIALYIPTLRLTYKINTPVVIVVYRWSVANPIYYQVSSITVPTLNNTAVDYITYTDTQADASIIGNNILYTTGGVIENISPPASNIVTLFNNRLWLVDAEDPNLLWFSKQVIENTPVEMSDLLTIYVSPTTASEGSTGPITALAPMDDKLIVFKQNALGYINGIGPDNTGANNGYSDFTLINSVVGSTNQQSLVFMPQGIMFQSNKGIWLVGRDLSTNYIGAPVESLTTDATVLSAINVPATNQVRFTLDSGITLIYDYYFNQWGTFINIPAISSTIYQGLHTYINSYGQVFQETPGIYLDNSSPVLMSFTTGWINLAGLQGFERFYYSLLLGTYISPFTLNVQFGYDYNPSAIQSTIVSPAQLNSTWGSDSLWGGGPSWGSATNESGIDNQATVFEARVFPQVQKCESFQVTINELNNGTQFGAGLTLSGLGLVIGMKKGYRNNRASRNFG